MATIPKPKHTLVVPTAAKPVVFFSSKTVWRFCAGQYFWYTMYIERTENCNGAGQRIVTHHSRVNLFLKYDGKTHIRVWKQSVSKPIHEESKLVEWHPRMVAFKASEVPSDGSKRMYRFDGNWTRKDLDLSPMSRAINRKLAKFRAAKHSEAVALAASLEKKAAEARAEAAALEANPFTLLQIKKNAKRKASEAEAAKALLELAAEPAAKRMPCPMDKV